MTCSLTSVAVGDISKASLEVQWLYSGSNTHYLLLCRFEHYCTSGVLLQPRLLTQQLGQGLLSCSSSSSGPFLGFTIHLIDSHIWAEGLVKRWLTHWPCPPIHPSRGYLTTEWARSDFHPSTHSHSLNHLKIGATHPGTTELQNYNTLLKVFNFLVWLTVGRYYIQGNDYVYLFDWLHCPTYRWFWALLVSSVTRVRLVVRRHSGQTRLRLTPAHCMHLTQAESKNETVPRPINHYNTRHDHLAPTHHRPQPQGRWLATNSVILSRPWLVGDQ